MVTAELWTKHRALLSTKFCETIQVTHPGSQFCLASPWCYDSCQVRLPERLWVSRRVSWAHVYAWDDNRRRSEGEGLDSHGQNFVEGRAWVSACPGLSLLYMSPPHVGGLSSWTSPFIMMGWGEHKFCCLLAGWDCNTHEMSLFCLDFWYLWSLFIPAEITLLHRIRALRIPHLRGKPNNRHIYYQGWAIGYLIVGLGMLYTHSPVHCFPQQTHRSLSLSHTHTHDLPLPKSLLETGYKSI